MRNIFILAFLLVGCAPDPWPGTWHGVTELTGSDCSTGERLTPQIAEDSMTITREDGVLYIGGASGSRCAIELEELSNEHALVVSGQECLVVNSEGIPYHYYFHGGTFELDGIRLDAEIITTITVPESTFCADSLMHFSGIRE